MSRGCHIQKTETGMTTITLCPFPSDIHYLPHFKCVLLCCSNYQIILIPAEESNVSDANACPTMRFCVYRLSVNFMLDVHMRENSISIVSNIVNNGKRSKSVHTKRPCLNGYIPCIISWEFMHSIYKNMVFHLLHVHALDTHHCAKNSMNNFSAEVLIKT